MKNSILILGMALVPFTNVCNAKSIGSDSTSRFPIGVFADDASGMSLKSQAMIPKPAVTEDAVAFNPETVIPFVSKTLDETIAQGDKIIENEASNDLAYMLYYESMKTIIAQEDLTIENSLSETGSLSSRTEQDDISELEMVIESKETNEERPLDFKKINSNPVMANSFNSKIFVGMK